MNNSTRTISVGTAAAPVRQRGQFAEAWRRLKKNRMAMAGLFILTVFILLSIFADVLFNYNDVVIKQALVIQGRI